MILGMTLSSFLADSHKYMCLSLAYSLAVLYFKNKNYFINEKKF